MMITYSTSVRVFYLIAQENVEGEKSNERVSHAMGLVVHKHKLLINYYLPTPFGTIEHSRMSSTVQVGHQAHLACVNCTPHL